MLNLTCPASVRTYTDVDTFTTAPCGEDATVLDVHVDSGEIAAYCERHLDHAGGLGYVVIRTVEPIHSTSLFTR